MTTAKHAWGLAFVAALFGTPLLVRLTEAFGTAPSMLVGYAWLAFVVGMAAWWGPLEFGWGRRKLQPIDVLLGVGAGALLFVLGGVGYAISEGLGLSTGVDANGVAQATGGAPLLVLAFCVAAVIEEIAFRGIFQRWLVERMTPALAVAAQAGLFAVWHLRSGQLLSTLLYGLILGALTVRRESLWPAVFAHLILNAAGAALFLSGVTG